VKGTPEGRRLFASCLGVGVGLGLVAGLGAAVAFHSGADAVPCHPDDPQNFTVCREIDLAGFQLRSGLEAAWTVGALVALVGWVLSVVAVLYSAQHHHRPEHQGPHW
jgi:hypothetical protein